MNSVRELINALLKLEERQPGSLDAKLLCIGKQYDDEYTLLSVQNIPDDLSVKYYFTHIDVNPTTDSSYALTTTTYLDNDDSEYTILKNKGEKTTPIYKVINLISNE